MQLNIETNSGPLAALFAEDAKTLALSMRSVLLRTGTTVKNSLRRIISRAGLGKLANAVQREVTASRGGLIDIAVTVRSKALVKRAGGIFDLVLVFGEGATVRPVNKRWLAIPFANIGRGSRGRKLAPADFPAGTLVFIPIQGNRLGLLLDKETRRPMFLLIRKTTIRARYDLSQALKPLERIIPSIIRDWERRRAKQFAKAA